MLGIGTLVSTTASVLSSAKSVVSNAPSYVITFGGAALISVPCIYLFSHGTKHTIGRIGESKALMSVMERWFGAEYPKDAANAVEAGTTLAVCFHASWRLSAFIQDLISGKILGLLGYDSFSGNEDKMTVNIPEVSEAEAEEGALTNDSTEVIENISEFVSNTGETISDFKDNIVDNGKEVVKSIINAAEPISGLLPEPVADAIDVVQDFASTIGLIPETE